MTSIPPTPDSLREAALRPRTNEELYHAQDTSLCSPAQPAPQGASEGWESAFIRETFPHLCTGLSDDTSEFMRIRAALIRFAPTATGVSEDTRRVDWLEGCQTPIFQNKPQHGYELNFEIPFGVDLRAAIDAAQSSQGSTGGQP